MSTVTHNGKTYRLTAQADYTNRLLPAPQVNYNDAAEGEPYDFEMYAPAVSDDGLKVVIYWELEGIKGDNDPALDTHEYGVATRIEVM